jgi:hypothetical protein
MKFFALALIALLAGCTITVRPIAQKKKIVYRSRHHHRVSHEAEPMPSPSPSPHPLQNLYGRPYKFITPSPSPSNYEE